MSEQSVQFEILDAVAQKLGGKEAGAYRCRFSDFASAELPADNVIPETVTPQDLDTDDVDRAIRFHVRYTAAAADEADRAADARYVRGSKLLLADLTLGGLVRRLREIGIAWEMERSEVQQVALVVTYEAEFSTSRRNPSVAGY